MGLIPSHNRGGIAIIAVAAVVSFLAIVATLLRVWARRLKNSPLDVSDWMCIVALLIALSLFGSVIFDVIQGLGLPMEEVSPEQFERFNKSILFGLYVWTTSNTLIRISTLLLYLRIFPLPTFSRICWLVLTLNVSFALATYVVAALICRPITYNWDQTIPDGHCGNKEALYLWHGIVNLIYDIIIVVMPMPLLWRLQLPFNKKVSLTVIFAMGLGICVLTLARVIEVSRGNVARITQDYVSVSILTMLEPLLGVISCSLGILRPVGQKLFGMFGNVDALKSDHGVPYDRPKVFRSIGSKGKLPKPTDPYALETNIVNGTDEDFHMRSLTASNRDSTGNSLDFVQHPASR